MLWVCEAGVGKGSFHMGIVIEDPLLVYTDCVFSTYFMFSNEEAIAKMESAGVQCLTALC
jgi:hypothetical protein